MFDEATRRLILSVPAGADLNPAELPNILSEAYVAISTLRLSANPESGDEVTAKASHLREIATKLSIYAGLVDTQDARAPAFVAASAFQLLATVPGQEADPPLNGDSVPDAISAALLFLTAGYPADAAQMARAIPIDGAVAPFAQISLTVRNLCLGNLTGVRNGQFPQNEALSVMVRAETSLFERIHRACVLFASAGLGDRDLRALDEATAILERVIAQSVRTLQVPILDNQTVIGFVTANHIARLLSLSFGGISSCLLSQVPTPSGSDENSWRGFIRERVRERPFLWSNHVSAVQSGILNEGTSGVISFPTGSGKSTLAHLKIATVAMRGMRVVYLVPTLALAWQTQDNLRSLLPDNLSVTFDGNEDQIYGDLSFDQVGDIHVLTPERCLLWMGLEPDWFKEVGLIVFDECHLLHKGSISTDDRSLDAMLCFLGLLQASENADVLLMSAMIRNAEELAGWLEEKFAKKVLVANDAWKPTRQARGSVIFRRRDLHPLRDSIETKVKRNERLRKSEAVAAPLGLFSLTQTWRMPGNDFKILPLLSEPLQMTPVRQFPWIRLNSADAAKQIARQAARQGLKVIVFFPNPASVIKAAREALEEGLLDPLTSLEERLLSATAEELGGREFVFRPGHLGAGHCGELLFLERLLVESAFKRANGVSILFATSTLAQGINLPADMVVIARTSSRDQSGEVRVIEAYELLNAAGRAGRAGLAAYGSVLVIPDFLVEIEGENIAGYQIKRLINDILSQEDRCLDVQDPLAVMLDHLTVSIGTPDDQIDSMLLRLTAPESAERATAILDRSLAAYQAQRHGKIEEFKEQMALAIEVGTLLLPQDSAQNVKNACRATGLTPEMIQALYELVQERPLPGFDVLAWYDLCVKWLNRDARIATRLDLKITGEASERSAMESWVSGTPLVHIQRILQPAKNEGMLIDARKFSRNAVRSASYCVGLMGQLLSHSDLEGALEISEKTARIAAMMREGFSNMGQLILYQAKRPDYWTRVSVHTRAGPYLELANIDNQMPAREMRRRINMAIRRVEKAN